jgi:glucose dehydrogenase
VDLMELDFDRLCPVLHSYRVDDQTVTAVVETDKGAEVFTRRRVRGDLTPAAGVGQVPRSIDEQDRETWGTTPEQQAQQRAVMAMMGPPAQPVNR